MAIPSTTQDRPRLHLIVLLLAAFLLLVTGLQRSLPLLPDVDEGTFVEAGVRVAATGSVDPGFYGHPGATVIYPLAAGYRLWHAWTEQGRLLAADPRLAAHFAAQAWEYYFLGRLYNAGLCTAAVALVALLGRRAWGAWSVGLAAGWLTAVNLTIVFHAKMVRTDAAGMFFGLLAAWLALRILAQPTLRWHLLAGAAAGLAAASRYFVGVVALLIPAASLLAVWRDESPPQNERRRRLLRAAGLVALAAAAALAVFLLANPALILNPAGVVADLRKEARTTHLGADGLTPLGNLLWYLGEGLPTTAGLVAWLALAGIATTALEGRRGRDRRGAWLLLLYAAAFTALISLGTLHWHRWLIPVLPAVLLFASAALHAAVEAVLPRLRWSDRRAHLLFGGALLLLLAVPLARLIRLDIQHVHPDTRLLARAWVLENLPPESRLLQETYGAPLQGTPFASETVRALVDVLDAETVAAADLQPLAALGYDYVVVSNAIYGRFLAEPDRYPAEVAFYERLFAEGDLAQEFAPAWDSSGPVLRIYAP